MHRKMPILLSDHFVKLVIVALYIVWFLPPTSAVFVAFTSVFTSSRSDLFYVIVAGLLSSTTSC